MLVTFPCDPYAVKFTQWRRAPTVTAVRDKLFPYREYKNEPSRASRDMETAKDDNVINLAPSGSSLPRPSSAQSAISMVSDMVSTAAAVALPLGGEGDTTGHRKKDLAGDTASGVDNNGIAPGWEASLLEGGGIDEDEGKAASNGPARGDPADHSTPLLRPSVLGEADEHEDEERGQSLQEAQSADSSRLFEPLAEKESLPLMEGTLSNDDDAIASAGAGSVGVDGCTIQLSAESDGDGDGVSSSRSADQTKPVRDDNRESDVGVGDDDDDDDDQGQHTKGEAEKRGEEKRVATLTGPAVEEAGIASGIVEEEEEAVKDEIMGDGAQESEALLRADDGTAVMREGVMPSKDEADCVSEEGLIATEDRGSAAALAPPTNVDGADDAASSADERADGDGECSPYRGDAAYASLLIAEHLELFFRQQVPYLLSYFSMLQRLFPVGYSQQAQLCVALKVWSPRGVYWFVPSVTYDVPLETCFSERCVLRSNSGSYDTSPSQASRDADAASGSPGLCGAVGIERDIFII